MKLDETHLRLLRALQTDAGRSMESLAAELGVSQTTLWRRQRELDAAGIIAARATILDPDAVGFTVCAFVDVNIVSHNDKHRRAFEALVAATPEILECFSLTGPHDYILKVRVADIAAYEKLLMDRILAHSSVASASSNITLRQHKSTTALPL